MKKFNSIIVATILATFAFTMFAFQPTVTEASSNATPNATPTPRKKRVVYSSNVEVRKPKVKGAIKKSPKQTQRSRKRVKGKDSGDAHLDY